MKQEIKNRIEKINNGIVPEGYKKTDFGIVPLYWEKYSISDISIGNGQYGLNAPACAFNSKLPKYIRITDIDDEGRYIDTGACVKQYDCDNYVLSENDIVFARTGASVGKNYLYNKKDGILAFAGFLIRYKLNKEIVNSYLVKRNCTTKYYDRWVKMMSARSGQPGINAEEYSKYAFYIPKDLKEQESIAKILMKWDEMVELQENYIEKLEIRKKSLMQQLLTGKQRLPGFTGEWENCKLKKYLQEETKRNASSNINNVLSVSNKLGFISQLQQFEQSIASADTSNYKVVSIGCIAYNPSRINVGSIAYYDCKESGIVSPMYVVFRTNKNLNAEYFMQIIRTHTFNEKIKIMLSGSVRDSLNFNDLCELTFTIPPLEEQKAIADILSKADEEIELNKQKLEKIKEQRKTLQQYLLMGIVRVKLDA